MLTDKPNYIHVERLGEICVVSYLSSRIVGEQTIFHVGEALFSLFDQGERKILIDFIGVEVFCAVILGKLLALRKCLEKVGGKLVLCQLSPDIYENYLERLHKKEVFVIQELRQEAFKEF